LLPQLQWHSDLFALLVVGFREGICFLPEALSLFRTSPQSYSARGFRTRQQRVVLGELLNCLLAPTYRDVLPFFQIAPILCHFGGDMVRAAARRPDGRSLDVLLLLSLFPRQEYEKLLRDGSEGVAEMAALLLSPAWGRVRDRALEELSAQIERSSDSGLSAAELLCRWQAA
jgi:hypothetical protein